MVKKPDAAAIELQLSQRRFVLEAITTAARLLEVPVITAGVWYYLSRTNPTLGALNKAMLAAELAPIIGDIKFPEGVLLGAAMESTEDFLKILEGEGLLDVEEVISKAHKATIDSGDVLAEFFMPKSAKLMTCEQLNERLFTAHLLATGRMVGPEGVIPNPEWEELGDGGKALLRSAATIDFGFELKAIKNNGCPKPTYPYFVTDKMWADA